MCYNMSPATSDVRVKRLLPFLALEHFRGRNRHPVILMNKTANLVKSPDNGDRRQGLRALRAMRRGIGYVGGRLGEVFSFRNRGNTVVIGGCS